MSFSLKNHFILKANYNQRLNQQVYHCASQLSDSDRKLDRKAFFHSIHNTLNHIMVGDLAWLGRFAKHKTAYAALDILGDYPKPKALDEVLFENFEELKSKRESLDEAIITWVSDDIEAKDYDEVFEFQRMNGETYRLNFAEVLFHFFNHQTHHRGQVSTLLSQCDQDIGVTDFLMDIPNEGAR